MLNNPFSPRQLLAQVVSSFAYSAREKGLELDFKVDASVPDACFGDVLRLRQVLMNLVGNAIKFTEKGKVFIQVKIPEVEEPTVIKEFFYIL